MTLPNTDWTIDISKVSKTYGAGLFGRGASRVPALQDASIRVHRGAVFGLLGPNGAGKSTLVKILMTVIQPTTATGTMLGAPIGDKPTLARVGYLPEQHRFPEYLTGAQVLEFYGALAKVPRATVQRNAGPLLEMVGMTAWAGKRVTSYSKGMRQRLGIANALINNPDLILLDEPTDGVDPIGRRDIRNAILELKRQGKTIVINSHLLSELDSLCDRIAILVKGRVAAQGSVDELTRGNRGYEVVVERADPQRLAMAMKQLLSPVHSGHGDGLGTLVSGGELSFRDGILRLDSDSAATIQPIIDALRRADEIIVSVRPIRPTLEDLFMQAVIDPTTGRAATPGAQRPDEPALIRPAANGGQSS